MNIINPVLLAKLRALHSIFFDQWRQVPLYRFPTFNQFQEPVLENPHSTSNQVTDLEEKEDDSDKGGDSSSSGGGIIQELNMEDPYSNYNQPIPKRNSGSLKDLVKKEDEGKGGDSSGGGTMKGLRVEKEIPRLTRP
jgi:hypothetical protein